MAGIILGVSGWRGARGLDDAAVVREGIARLAPAKVITGACAGIDTIAAREAWLMGIFVHTLVPGPLVPFYVNWVKRTEEHKPEWAKWCNTFELLPEASTYPMRNQKLVDACAELLAFPQFAEMAGQSRRSGTWQTVRIARFQQKTVHIRQLR